MVTHANIVANTDSIIDCLDLTQNDRMMVVLPFHYCFGTSLLHTHLRVGGSLVVGSRFGYLEDMLRRLEHSECTGFAGVPSHFQILLRNSSLRKKIFPHLRYVQQAGGHLAPSFVHELRQVLPHTRIYIMYGQTEATARLAWLPPECLEAKTGSIGTAIPGVTLRVLSSVGTEVRPGEIGEIVAEGENITLGYWRSPDESARYFRDGRLFTGDLATVDDDGFIFLVDRAKDFVKCAGRRISCRQIEDRLLESEALLEAAVVGVPDEVLGEALKIFLVLGHLDSIDIKELVRTRCGAYLPYQLKSKDIVILSRLPKNSAGKVLKQELKKLTTETNLEQEMRT